MSLTDRDRKLMMIILPLVLVLAFWFLVLSPKRKEAKTLSTQVTTAQQARDTAVAQAATLEQAKSRFATEYAEMVRLGKALPTNVDMPSLLVQLSQSAKGTGIEFGDIHVGPRAVAPPVTPITLPGAKAQTSLGQIAQNAAGAQAAENSAANASNTAASAAGATGATGATGAAGAVTTSNAPGLDEVPLTFKFGGQFFDLADFFHHLKRFVRITNSKIHVQGRLLTIDSLKFASTKFPDLEADVTATIYLTPKDEGTTAGATSTGPQGAQSAAIAAVSTPTTGTGTQ
jgi:Tfp pilus assembly protein PilO